MAANGSLSPDSRIWRDGLTAWVPARSVKGLFAIPEQTAPHQPPSSTEEDFVQQVLQEPSKADPELIDSSTTVEYQHYRIPDVEFPKLKRERLPLVIVGWFFTIAGVCTVGQAFYHFYQMFPSETAIARNAQAYLFAASLVGGMAAIGVGSIFRMLAAGADVAMHIAKLLGDIRRQGKTR